MRDGELALALSYKTARAARALSVLSGSVAGETCVRRGRHHHRQGGGAGERSSGAGLSFRRSPHRQSDYFRCVALWLSPVAMYVLAVDICMLYLRRLLLKIARLVQCILDIDRPVSVTLWTTKKQNGRPPFCSDKQHSGGCS